MDIDAIIAEAAKPEVEAQVQPKDAVSETESKQESEVAEPKADDKPIKVDEPFPKKAVNAISYRDKKIGRQAEQIRSLKEELESLRGKAPKEADFEGKPYGDYLKAEAKHAAAEESTEREVKRIESRLKSEEAAYKEERGKAIAENAAEARKAFSDFDDVLKAAKPTLDSLPADIQELFLEADNGAYALFALAKEGVLDDLADMSPARAAMTIAKMEDKGLSLSKAKEVSKAPAPITPLKGTGTGGKSIEQMSGKELLKIARNS